jgi:DNA modification methylase
MNNIIVGDCLTVLRGMDSRTIDCCITSPPYYRLRDYGVVGQIGLEQTPEDYIAKLVEVFHEVKRVLKDEGTLWLNIGDSYVGSRKGRRNDGSHSTDKSKSSDYLNIVGGTLLPARIDGIKRKDLIGIPWLLAFALRQDGWYLRQDIIWNKTNAMPESVRDRCTKSHEYIFLLSKKEKYYFDSDSIVEKAAFDGRKDTINKGSLKYARKDILPGTTPQTMTMAGKAHERWRYKDGMAIRNKRDVWTVSTNSYKGAHFATFPEKLIEPCVLAGCRKGGIVLDPFIGSGTTAVVALKADRNYIGIELNPQYAEIAVKRINDATGSLAERTTYESKL